MWYNFLMNILGIDPGTAITGWGVIRVAKGKQEFIDAGVIETIASESLENRLMTIYDDVATLIKKFHPEAVAIEKLFFNTNAKTALAVGHSRGVVMLAVSQNGIPLYEYTPLQVKTAITGYGRADKKQMQEMIKRLLKLNSIIKPDDAADALAVAITHSVSIKIKNIP